MNSTKKNKRISKTYSNGPQGLFELPRRIKTPLYLKHKSIIINFSLKETVDNLYRQNKKKVII